MPTPSLFPIFLKGANSVAGTVYIETFGLETLEIVNVELVDIDIDIELLDVVDVEIVLDTIDVEIPC